VALPETRHSQIVYGLQSLRLDRLRTAPTRAIWRQTPNRFYPAKELLAGTQYLLLRYQEQYSTDVLDTQERKKRRSGLTPAAPFLPIPEGRGIRARSSAIRRKEMLASLRSAGRNMAALEFATRETVEAVARPLTPALAFGALVYMWILIWLVPAPPM
jgi:hypothetical protein